MLALGPCEWKVADVCAYLKDNLELPDAVVEAFRENAVAGPDFITLSDDDLKELGCKPLQARKIRHALTSMGFKPPSEGPQAEAAPLPAAAAVPVAPAPAPAPAQAATAAAAPAAPAPAPAPTSGYPPPAGYPAAAPYGAPPPAYGAPPPGPAYPEEKQDHTGRKVAAAVLLTRPNRMMRRAYMMNN